MAKHSERGLDGRFRRVDVETDLGPVNISAQGAPPGVRTKFAPAVDGIDGPTGHRTRIVLDGGSGDQLGRKLEDTPREWAHRGAEHAANDHEFWILGGE